MCEREREGGEGEREKEEKKEKERERGRRREIMMGFWRAKKISATVCLSVKSLGQKYYFFSDSYKNIRTPKKSTIYCFTVVVITTTNNCFGYMQSTNAVISHAI